MNKLSSQSSSIADNQVTSLMASHSTETHPYPIRVVNAIFNIYGINTNSTKLSTFICAVFNSIFIVYTSSRLLKHARVFCLDYDDFFALVYFGRYLTYFISRISVLWHFKKLIKLYGLVIQEYSLRETSDFVLGRAFICIPLIWLVTVILLFIFYVIVLYDQGVISFLEENDLMELLPSQIHLGHKIRAIAHPLLFSLIAASWFPIVTLVEVLISYVISTQKKRVIASLTERVKSSMKISELRTFRSDFLEITNLSSILNQLFEVSYFFWICYTFALFSCLMTTVRNGLYGHESNFISILSEVGTNLTESSFILATVYFDHLFNRNLDTSLHKLIEAESKSTVNNDDLIELIQLIQNNANFNLKLYSAFQVNLCLVLKLIAALVPIAVIINQLNS